MTKITDLLKLDIDSLSHNNFSNYDEVVVLIDNYKTLDLKINTIIGKIDYWEDLAQNAYNNIIKYGNDKSKVDLYKKEFENFVAEINHLEQTKSRLMQDIVIIQRRIEIASIGWDLRAM